MTIRLFPPLFKPPCVGFTDGRILETFLLVSEVTSFLDPISYPKNK